MSDCRIQTYTGIYFDVLEPNPNDVNIEDIAHAISNQCRFTGHVKTFYSVAEHSVRASYLVPKELALCALMHDATEAYLVDLPSPIKRHSELGKYFRPIENTLWQAIATHFNLPLEIPKEVHDVDNIMLLTEKRDLMDGNKGMSDYARKWVVGDGLEPLETTIVPCLPETAEKAFLIRFGLLTDSLWPLCTYCYSYTKSPLQEDLYPVCC